MPAPACTESTLGVLAPFWFTRVVTNRNWVIALALLAGVQACKESSSPPTPVAPLRVEHGLLVARGLGSIGGVRTTNSLEALRCNYQRGFRWFDVDLSVTADGELVCLRKGTEKLAGLPRRVGELTVAEVEGKQYAERFPIQRLSRLLEETDRLGDVVLVMDTGGWSERVEHALSRTLGYGPKHKTRIVLQVSSEMDVKSIATLSQELGASVMVKLRRLREDDAKVEALVKKAQPLAVVVNNERFTPWLAERLHALNTPVLVAAVNEHADIVRLTRAGADGFYTDHYLPFGRFTANPDLAMECGETQLSARALRPWTRRDLQHEADVILPECAARKRRRVTLSSCAADAVLSTSGLPAPPGRAASVEVDAEAGKAGARFWLEVVEELPESARQLRPRQEISLKPGERRTVELQLNLPSGSPGVQVRLGLASEQDELTLHHLRVAQHAPAASEPPAGERAAAATPRGEPDAGD